MLAHIGQVVNASIHFKGESRLRAVEVENVLTHEYLPVKPPPAASSTTYNFPNARFGRGLVAPQLFCPLAHLSPRITASARRVPLTVVCLLALHTASKFNLFSGSPSFACERRLSQGEEEGWGVRVRRKHGYG